MSLNSIQIKILLLKLQEKMLSFDIKMLLFLFTKNLLLTKNSFFLCIF